jgi:SAM-dependent methyltransferase
MSIVAREEEFYDRFWQISTKPHTIEGKITIPGVSSLMNKRVLICSCGSGYLPVQAAKEGAEVFAFDISKVAIDKANEMAAYNGVTISTDIMDFHSLKYPDNYFDVIHGTMILHHIDCSIVSKELYRCLKPNGIAFFKENSDRNPILRFFRRTIFGKPGEIQKNKFLFFKRGGTSDEYPLTDDEIDEFRQIFGEQNLRLYFEDFMFFKCLSSFAFDNRFMRKVTGCLDTIVISTLPFLRKYSFSQEVWMRKAAT